MTTPPATTSVLCRPTMSIQRVLNRTIFQPHCFDDVESARAHLISSWRSSSRARSLRMQRKHAQARVGRSRGSITL